MKNKTKKISVNAMFMMILLLIILALEAVGGIILYSAYVKEKNCSVKTEGVLIEWGVRTRKNKKRYYPIVEYRSGNEIYTGISNVEAGKLPMQEGDPVVIGYNPSNPYEFYIEGYDLNLTRAIGGIFIIMGTVIVVFNIICAALNRINMDGKKRTRIKEILLALSILFIFYWMVITLSGIGMALFATLLISPVILYVKCRKRRKHREDSLS